MQNIKPFQCLYALDSAVTISLCLYYMYITLSAYMPIIRHGFSLYNYLMHFLTACVCNTLRKEFNWIAVFKALFTEELHDILSVVFLSCSIVVPSVVIFRKRHKIEQGNRNSNTSPVLCIPVTVFPAIGDAAYRQHAGGGPSHGHRQHAQKFGKDRACGSVRRYPRGQTHRHTDIVIAILRNHPRGRSKHL